MIEYITGLFIYYTVANTDVYTVIWYENEKKCLEAMIDRAPLYISLDAEAMLCKKSNKISKEPLKPKIRPKAQS
tara:strand:+ start:598 stop:819 length:222 start_codon:yes stop_codon:yes gene_type:complete